MHLPKVMVLVAAIAGLVGCERLTAPQARDVVEKTERQLISGDSAQLQAGFRSLLAIAAAFDADKSLLSDTVTLVRNGETFYARATIAEIVYLPPAASSARPLIVRSAIVWSGDALRAPDSARIIVLFSAGKNETIPPPTNLRSDSDAVRDGYRINSAASVEPGDRREWAAIGGIVRISQGDSIAACPYITREARRARGLTEETANMGCDTRRFLVSFSGQFEAFVPGTSFGARRATTSNLEVPSQQIRGIRFLTQCKRDQEDYVSPCRECK